MELMILNVFVSIHIRSIVWQIRNVLERNAQIVMDLQVHGPVPVDPSLQIMLQLFKHTSKEKVKVNH